MKIIKQGKPKEEVDRLINATKRFECKRCDCIFEADKDEYKSCEFEYNRINYYCICPNCGIQAYEVTMRKSQSQLEFLGY